MQQQAMFGSHLVSALLELISPYIMRHDLLFAQDFLLIRPSLPFVLKPKITTLSVLVLWKCFFQNRINVN